MIYTYKTIEDILRESQPYYKGRERYYHNFDHITHVMNMGQNILNSLNIDEPSSREAFNYAIGFHDAGHLNGKQEYDRENIDRALDLFNKHKTNQEPKNKFLSSLIINSTCVPLIALNEIENLHRMKNAKNLIMAARDADHLGIMGIENDQKREEALVGLTREFLQNYPVEKVQEMYENLTNEFFDGVYFYTKYVKKWANKGTKNGNLEKRRRWQIEFTPKAIERAVEE